MYRHAYIREACRVGLIAVWLMGSWFGSHAMAQELESDPAIEEALEWVEKRTAEDQLLKPDVVIDTLEFKNEDIHAVLEVIAEKGRLNIITGPNVLGKVSIFLKNVDARDALRIILDTNDLAYSEESGIIRVLTATEFEERYGYPFTQKTESKMVPVLHADPLEILDVLNQMKSESGKIIYNEQSRTFVLMDTPDQIAAMDKYVKKVDVPIDRQTIELKHIRPIEAVNHVQDMLSPDKGDIEIDNEQNTITIIDNRTVIQNIRERIAELDQAEKRILLTAKILQIILNDEHTSGVDWEAIVSDFTSLEFLGLKNAIEGKEGFISLGTVTDEDYEVLLEALETVGEISELDNLESTLVKEEIAVISVNGLDAVDLSEQKSNMETKDKEEDLRFYVKPLGYQNDQISIHIKPEVFSLAEKTTNIDVVDGSTIIIGGLFKNVTVRTERKIPLIGDIPLIRDVPFSEIPFLGFAFRNQKKSIRKTEIIVFVTAKTVSGNDNSNVNGDN